MRKIIILGIDAMDRELVKKYIDEMPNLKSIDSQSYKINSKSTFPPDSDTAWATIYTGLNPAKHGIVDFVDPLDRKKIHYKASTYIDQDFLKSRTFWKIAGDVNYKSCLVFPHLITKPWNINGSLLFNDPETDDLIFNSDSKLKLEKKIPGQKRIPKSKIELRNYIENKKAVVQNEFEIAKKLFVETDWNLYFFYSSTLDSIMHIFWNYCDQDDPTYPGKNKFESTIKDFHVLYDELIGDFVKLLEKDDVFIMLSDHGHHRRPTNLFNINEFLKLNGYLVAKEKNNFVTVKSKLKRLAVDIAQRSGMRPLAQTILRIFPRIKDSYSKPESIDFVKTIAHCTDLSGLKAYTYGGIIVREENLPKNKSKSKIIDEIIKVLENVTLPNSDTKIFEWIKRREELYDGEYLTKYPDIVFNLIDNYGAGWDVNIPLFTRSLAHKFYPGSHRGSTPIFYLLAQNVEVSKFEIELMDVAPTILQLMGIDSGQFNFDGESIIKK